MTIHRVPSPVRMPPGTQEAGWRVRSNPLFRWSFARHIEQLARQEGADADPRSAHGIAGRGRASRDGAAGCRSSSRCATWGSSARSAPARCSSRGRRSIARPQQYVGRCVPFYLRNYAPERRGLRRTLRRLRLRWAWRDHQGTRRALQQVDGVIGVSARHPVDLSRAPRSQHPASRRLHAAAVGTSSGRRRGRARSRAPRDRPGPPGALRRQAFAGKGDARAGRRARSHPGRRAGRAFRVRRQRRDGAAVRPRRPRAGLAAPGDAVSLLPRRRRRGGAVHLARAAQLG